jgi:hypothetical protein
MIPIIRLVVIHIRKEGLCNGNQIVLGFVSYTTCNHFDTPNATLTITKNYEDLLVSRVENGTETCSIVFVSVYQTGSENEIKTQEVNT